MTASLGVLGMLSSSTSTDALLDGGGWSDDADADADYEYPRFEHDQVIDMHYSTTSDDTPTVTYTRKRNGKLHDGPDGEPALIERLAGEDGTVHGKVIRADRYQDGVRSDGLNGEPAHQVWSHRTGRLRYQDRYRNGKLHDGRNSDPAKQTWDQKDGTKSTSHHYANGLPNNGLNGDPAVQSWWSSGQLMAEARLENGVENDGPNGEPARRTWHRNGKLDTEVRYVNGSLHDGPHGEPAVHHRDEKGKTTVKQHYQNGKEVRKPPLRVRLFGGAR